MKIKYSRGGGRTPPRDREVLTIEDDGVFTLWRSVGRATNPPAPVGRFAGELPKAQLAKLDRAAESAAKAGNLAGKPVPGAAIETIELEGAKARIGSNDKAEGEWSALVGQLRDLLGTLTDSPVAAIALEVDEDGGGARLIHQGDETLRLDLSNLAVRAVLWEGSRTAGDWRSQTQHSGDMKSVEAGPGWSLDLPFEHNFDVEGASEVVAYATFTAYDGQLAVPVSLATPRRKG